MLSPILERDLNRLRDAAKAWVKSGRTDYGWCTGPDRKEQKYVHLQDGRDLMSIHAAIKKEDWAWAWRQARSLDTIVRDQIPCRLYNRMAREVGAT